MLGKGLESLIPPKPASPQAGSSPVQPIQDIQPPATSHQASAYVDSLYSQQSVQSVSPSLGGPVAPFTLHEHQEPVVYEEPVRDIIQIPTQEPSLHKSAAITPPIRNSEPPTPRLKDEAVFQIEIDKIRPNPEQPRREFDEVALRELASSIREYGVIQPIVVTKVETESEDGTRVEYELIAGERRLKASKLAGLHTVPVIVRRGVSEREKLELAIIENIQRRDLNPIECAKAFSRLQDEFNLTQREIGARLGKSREAIANSVRLLNLPADIQDAVASGRINESQARLLLSVDDIGKQKVFFDDVLRGNLSVRDIKTMIARAKTETPASNFSNPETEALKERLEGFLGTKVELKDEGNSGQIKINFYSKEELKAILDKVFGGNS